MSRSTVCPPPAKLEELLQRTLPADREAELAEHLSTCAACQSALEDLTGDFASFNRSPAGSASPNRRPNLALPAGSRLHETGFRGADGSARDGALEHAMNKLKAEPLDLGAPSIPSATGEIALDFLQPSDKPGQLGRFGSYEVTECLGRGGMGVVLKAFDAALNRFVAIKVLAPQLATSAAARRRFAREAQATAAVSHEHVVAIHAVDETNGLPYLVMEYVPGISLEQRIDRSGPLELKEILRIGMQAAAGLAAAHAQGLVHRDIKPANILLENGVERVKITDFGLARAVDDASLTQSGVVPGTPQYMAPEQAAGESADHRADLFSLGSVLYAMCTGHPPFRAETAMAVLRRVSDDTPRRADAVNPDVPAWLADFIARLHERDPAARFQSAAEAAELLRGCLAHVQQPGREPLPAAVCNLRRPSDPPSRTRRWAAVAAAALVLFAGLGLSETTGYTRVTELAAEVLRIRWPNGTLVIETDDSDISIAVDGNEVTIRGAGPHELTLRPGQHQVEARKGSAVQTDWITVARGGKNVVKVRLEPSSPEHTALSEAGTGAANIPQEGQAWVEYRCPKSHASTAKFGDVAPTCPVCGATMLRVNTERDRATDVGKKEATAESADGNLRGSPRAAGWVEYVVQAGDTLASIAEKMLGDKSRWVELLDANRDRLDDPNRLRVRLRLRVPHYPDERTVVAHSCPKHPDVVQLSSRESPPCPTCGEPMTRIQPGSHPVARKLGPPLVPLAHPPLHLATLFGHAQPVWAVAFSPNGKRLASVSGIWNGDPGEVCVWDVATGELIARVNEQNGMRTAAFSRDGNWLFATGYDGLMNIFPGRVRFCGASDTFLRTVFAAHGPSGVNSLAFSPDGQWLATGGLDSKLKLWPVRSDAAYGQPPYGKNPVDIDGVAVFPEQPAWVLSVAFSPDSRTLAAALHNSTGDEPQEGRAVLLFDVATRRLTRRLVGHSNIVEFVTFSPDGKTLASTSWDGTVKLWDVASGKELATLAGHVGAVWSAAFSPDGQVLAVGTGHPKPTKDEPYRPGQVKLWHIATRTERTLNIHNAQVTGVAFSPDGKLLATASWDKTVMLWDMTATWPGTLSTAPAVPQ